MSRETIPQEEALRLQLAMIAGGEPEGSFFEIRFKRPEGMGQLFIGVRERDRAASAILHRGRVADTYVGAAPRVRESGTADAVERVWTLWVDCDSSESVERLRTFSPAPNIVIRSGTADHLHAWWQLRDPLSAHAQRANRRLALALGADRAATDAARIMRPAGTLNRKHDRPRPVVCVRLELDTHRLADIVGGLPDDAAYERPPERPSRGATDGGAALDGLARVVREAPVGERNNALNWSAYRAGEHIAAGALSVEEAKSELLAAALEVGLPDCEARRTISSGLDAIGRTAA